MICSCNIPYGHTFHNDNMTRVIIVRNSFSTLLNIQRYELRGRRLSIQFKQKY